MVWRSYRSSTASDPSGRAPKPPLACRRLSPTPSGPEQPADHLGYAGAEGGARSHRPLQVSLGVGHQPALADFCRAREVGGAVSDVEGVRHVDAVAATVDGHAVDLARANRRQVIGARAWAPAQGAVVDQLAPFEAV